MQKTQAVIPVLAILLSLAAPEAFATGLDMAREQALTIQEAQPVSRAEVDEEVAAGVTITRPAPEGGPTFSGFTGGGTGGGGGRTGGGGGGSATGVNLVIHDVCSDESRFRIVGTTLNQRLEGIIVYENQEYKGTDVTSSVDVSRYVEYSLPNMKAYVFDVTVPAKATSFVPKVVDNVGREAAFPVTASECLSYKILYGITGGTVFPQFPPFFSEAVAAQAPVIERPTSLLETTIQYDSRDYTIKYSGNLFVNSVAISETDKSVTISLSNPVSGTAQLDVSEIVQGDYVVTAGGQIIPFERTGGVLSMMLDGVDTIEIVGTSIIPEFGLIALLILSIGFATIVLCKRPQLSFRY